MMYFKKIMSSFFIIAGMIVFNESIAQNFDGINFQGLIIENNDELSEQDVFLKFSFINNNNQIEYAEEQLSQTNIIGILTAVIGDGIPTGEGLVESIYDIDWHLHPMTIEVLYKLNETDDYIILDEVIIHSIIYTYHTAYAENDDAELSRFFDVEIENEIAPGYVLKYTDSIWVAKPEALYSLNSDSSIYSVYSDTALLAFEIDPVFYNYDTVSYSMYNDSVLFTLTSDYSEVSEESEYADSSSFALEILNAISLYGINENVVIGSLDSVAYSIISNGSIRVLIGSEGNILVNSPSSNIGVSINAKDGFLLSSSAAISGISEISQMDNGLFWNPKSRSLHLGLTNLYTLGDSGLYSFSGGKISIANSYSIAWGENTSAFGKNMVVFGKGSKSTSIAGTGIAIGDSCIVHVRSVALGDHARSTGGSTNIVIGSNVNSSGSTSLNLGSSISSQALTGSTAIGHSISMSNVNGSFVFADSHDPLVSISASNQFTAVADGGFIFYTDSLMTNGVELINGSGSWSSVSSYYKKKNAKYLNEKSIDQLIHKLDIYSWNYKTQNSTIKHIGPISNDLIENGLFNLTKVNDYYGLNASDMDGLILLGIKHINKEFDNILSEIENSSVAELKEINLDEMNKRLNELEKIYSNE